MHFGVKVTSSNEGAHAVLKRFLNDRTGNLLTVCKATHDHITLQARRIEQKLAYSHHANYTDLRHVLLRPLRQFATPEALRLINKQIHTLEKGTLRSCTGLFEQQMGLPCAHTIKARVEFKHGLEDDIHDHWKYFRAGSRTQSLKKQQTLPTHLMSIIEPATIVRTRGRPRKGQEDPAIAKDKSTTRWPSHWELNRGREVNTRLPTVARPPASAPASTSASAPVSIRGEVAERSEPASAQFVHDDINLPGLEELEDDDLEPFTHLQFDAPCAAFPAASPAAPPAAAPAPTYTTKKRGRPKGSKNKPRKKQSSELLYEEIEEQQQEVVEASASSYNTRRARRSNYAQLDDPFSSE